MSVKSKVKRCNKEILRLEKEINKLKAELYNNTVRKSSKEQLYENIIKFALTNHVGGLKCGMMVDYYSIDKMKDLELDVRNCHIDHSYIIRTIYK